MSRTRLTAAAAMSAAAALTLSACGNEGGGGGTDTADDPITITYSNFISNGGNEDNLAKIVAAFEADNPGITVDVRTLPYADYFTALQTDIVAGTEADVFDIEFGNFRSFQESGVLAPLDGVDTSVFQQSLADAYAVDGVQYALPSSFSTVVLFYNADLFDAAGIETPQRDWTWDDALAAAEQLTDADAGVWGLWQPISFHEYFKAVAQAGGQFLADDGTSVAFDSPEGVEAARWLVEKSGTVMPTAAQGADTPDFDLNLFESGKLAMWTSGIWMFGALADADFNWDIAVEPGSAQQASAMFSNAVAVSPNSEHQEAAQKFAEFLTASDLTAQTRLDAGWELPPITDQSKLAPFLEMDKPANRQAVFDSLDSVALMPTIGDAQAQMQDIVTEELGEAAAGRKSVEDAVASAAQRVNALLG